MKKIAPYLILFAAMLWATDAPFRIKLTQELPSGFIVLAEHFVDVLIVAPLLWWNRAVLKNLKTKQWLAILAIAIGGSALASVAFTQAFHYVNPSVAILLQKLQPLIAIGLAGTLLKERMGKHFWVWAAIALVGAYVITFPGLVPQTYPGEQFSPNLIGAGLALLAALLWGASTVLGRYVLGSVDFKVMTGLRFTLAFVFLLGFNLIQNTIPPLASVLARDWFYILIIAIASGVVSLFLYYRGLKDTKASIATLAELGFPMAAVVVNWIFIPGSGLAWPQVAGIALLLFSIYKLSGVNVSEASSDMRGAEIVS